MTSPVPQPVKPQKKRLKVEPEAGGQLEQFLIANKEAHDAAAEAGEREDETKRSIKNWLLSLLPAMPEEDRPEAFDIVADPHGRYPAYTMTLKGGTHLSTEHMPDDLLQALESYRVPNKFSWELREVTSQRRGRWRD